MKKIILISSVILIIIAGGLFVIKSFILKPVDTVTDRIYGLATIWKTAHELYGLWDLVPQLDWDEEFVCYAEKVLNIEKEDEREYYLELSKFLALLSDGHSRTIPPQSMYNYLHIGITEVDGKFFVTNTYSKTNSIPILSEITAVNGTDTESYIRGNMLVGIKTPGADLSCAIQDILTAGAENEVIELTLKTPEGEIINETLTYEINPPSSPKASFANPAWNNLPIIKTVHGSETFNVYELKGGIYLIIINTFMNDEIRAEFDRFMTTLNSSGKGKGFIIDVRNNNGGNNINSNSVLKWFIGEKQYLYINKSTQNISLNMAAKASKIIINGEADISTLDQNAINAILMLGNRYYGMPNGEFTPFESLNAESSRKPVIVLAGYGTWSAAEDFVETAKSAGILVLGTNTAGGTGTITMREFDDYSINITTENIRYRDGYTITNNGIQPDIWCPQTTEDLLNYKYTAISKAISLINLANEDPEAYERYIIENKYEYSIKPNIELFDTVGIVVERLSKSGTPDGILTDGEKILGLSEIWRRADAYYGGFEILDDNFYWDFIYKSYIKKVLETTSINSYYSVLEEFISRLSDKGSYVVRPDVTEKTVASETAAFIAQEMEKEIFLIQIKTFDRLAEELAKFINNNSIDAIILDVRSLDVENDINVDSLLRIFEKIENIPKLNYKVQTAPQFKSSGNYTDDNLHTYESRAFNGSYISNYHAPDYITQFADESLLVNIPVFEGPVIVLTNNQTAKTAEIFAIYAKQMERFTVIGEKTAGMPSETAVFSLPENGRFYISIMSVKSNEGVYINNTGIEPNILFKSIDVDSDTFVKKVIEYIINLGRVPTTKD